jgi:hypothetical protein
MGKLEDSVFLGPFVRYRVGLESGSEIVVHSPDIGLRHSLALGDAVRLRWSPERHRVLPH